MKVYTNFPAYLVNHSQPAGCPLDIRLNHLSVLCTKKRWGSILYSLKRWTRSCCFPIIMYSSTRIHNEWRVPFTTWRLFNEQCFSIKQFKRCRPYQSQNIIEWTRLTVTIWFIVNNEQDNLSSILYYDFLTINLHT